MVTLNKIVSHDGKNGEFDGLRCEVFAGLLSQHCATPILNTPIYGPNDVEIPNRKTWFRWTGEFLLLNHQIQNSKFAFFGIVYTISGNTHG